MEAIDKLALLGESAKYDVCAASSRAKAKTPSGVCHSFTPDGRCISLLRVLLTNICDHDCLYCPNRAGRDIARASFSPEELAALFMAFYKRNYVSGLFLSSGIAGSVNATMDKLLTTVTILRRHYHFSGYVHLKLLPQTDDATIEAAVKLATRVSLNMETPTADQLSRLSEQKGRANIRQTLDRTAAIIRRHGQQVSQSTQFLVGAAGESDLELLTSATDLYASADLTRAYFSTFQPVANTPLAAKHPVPLLREHRLYQSDFLLRRYGFALSDFSFAGQGNLDLNLDPKIAYALHNPSRYPVEINRASYDDLLRVPGIGPRSAARIIRIRRNFAFHQPEELKNVGLALKRSLPFITLNGRRFTSARLLDRPTKASYEQLSLFGWQV